MNKKIAEIKRYPVRKNDLLQGWDSADELALEYLRGIDLTNKRILIINDSFGALSCSLADQDTTVYTDSYVSHRGIKLNSNDQISTIQLLSHLKGNYDFVIIKIPKNMSFFEDILCQISGHLTEGSKIISTSMIKHLAPTSFDLLQKYIGKTSTSLAQKKARLVFADFEKKISPSPYPFKVKIEGFDVPFVNHSNLFSRDKLDIGTRFFLEHIPQGSFEKILDLGCANGIIGLRAKQLNMKSEIYFSDDSYLAIKSAQENYTNYFSDDAHFFWTNCFENGPKDSLDLVLCNPPFHQGNTIGDFIAEQMFLDGLRSLKRNGKMRVIGNSHLKYHLKLKRIFGNFTVVASNNKFTILDSIKN